MLSASDTEHRNGDKKDEGSYNAFSGTLLGGGRSATGVSKPKSITSETMSATNLDPQTPLSASSAIPNPTMELDPPSYRLDDISFGSGPEFPCPVCTFLNPGGVASCTMCDAFLDA